MTNRPTVELRETHSGVVVLSGDHAYKSKKPVDLGFLDFRSPERRWEVCRREVELNRRLAPDVYFGVGSFHAPDQGPAEPVVVMRRLPDAARLSTLVLAGGAAADDALRATARTVAAFHASADRGPAIARAGRPPALWHRWTANLHESERYRGSLLDAATWDQVRRDALRYVDGRAALLDSRAESGCVVDGHGDLLADDIFCLPDGPRILDCLEFDDALRYVDVLDDVAFLAMDIERLGEPELAKRFLRWYEEFSAVPVVDSLQHHYIAYRSFVRAKVACIRAEQDDGAVAEADQYLQLAARHLREGDVRLVLVGGAPATGKSTLADSLGRELSWTVLRTDRIRQERPVDVASRYGQEARNGVYEAMLGRAATALRFGESVILDATWASQVHRQAAETLAATTSSTLVSLECTLPIELAVQRAQHRAAQGADPSEADADVVRRLAGARDPWSQSTVLDTSVSAAHVLREAARTVRAAPREASAITIGTSGGPS